MAPSPIQANALGAAGTARLDMPTQIDSYVY